MTKKQTESLTNKYVLLKKCVFSGIGSAGCWPVAVIARAEERSVSVSALANLHVCVLKWDITLAVCHPAALWRVKRRPNTIINHRLQ